VLEFVFKVGSNPSCDPGCCDNSVYNVTSTSASASPVSYSSSGSAVASQSVSSSLSPSGSSSFSYGASQSISPSTSPPASSSSSPSFSATQTGTSAASTVAASNSGSSAASLTNSPIPSSPLASSTSLASSSAPLASSSASASPKHKKSARIAYPAITNSQSVSSPADLISLTSQSTSIPESQLSTSGSKRDTSEPIVVFASQLDDSQAATIEDTTVWVAKFNSLAGTTLSASDVGVSVSSASSYESSSDSVGETAHFSSDCSSLAPFWLILFNL